jgi:hypothetical protein
LLAETALSDNLDELMVLLPHRPAITRAPAKVTLRELLIAAGAIRPSQNAELAQSQWDRLSPLHVPSWWPVFRLVPDRRREWS